MKNADEINQSLQSHIERYLKKTKKFNYHPLDEVFPRERRIKSIIAGLETSLGTTFWIKLSKKIAIANSFKVIKVKKLRSIQVPLEVKEYIDKLVSSNNPYENEEDILNNIQKLSDLTSENYIKIEDLVEKSMACIKKNRVKYFLIFKTLYPSSKQRKSNARVVFTKYVINRLLKDEKSEFKCIVVYPYEVENSIKDFSFYIKYGKEFWDELIGDVGTYDAIISAFKDLKNSVELRQYLED